MTGYYLANLSGDTVEVAEVAGLVSKNLKCGDSHGCCCSIVAAVATAAMVAIAVATEGSYLGDRGSKEAVKIQGAYCAA